MALINHTEWCTIIDCQVVEGVFHGEGVTWFRNSKLKRLMEDEACRFVTVERICKTINAKNSPDEHVADVVRELMEMFWFR